MLPRSVFGFFRLKQVMIIRCGYLKRMGAFSEAEAVGRTL